MNFKQSKSDKKDKDFILWGGGTLYFIEQNNNQNEIYFYFLL